MENHSNLSCFNKIIKPEPFSCRHLLNQTRLRLSWRPNLALLKLLVSFFNFTSPHSHGGENAGQFGLGNLRLAWQEEPRFSPPVFLQTLPRERFPALMARRWRGGQCCVLGVRLSQVSVNPSAPNPSSASIPISGTGAEVLALAPQPPPYQRPASERQPRVSCDFDASSAPPLWLPYLNRSVNQGLGRCPGRTGTP